MKLLKILFYLYLALLFTSCSGGGSSAENTQTQNISVTGEFIDSAVSGITYICSSDSSIEKLTTIEGKYTCQEGDSVTFSIGSVSLGTVEAKANQTITPYTLSPSDKTIAINIGRLLQTLDSDGDLANGIMISRVDAAKLTSSIDFSNENFVSDTQVKLGKTLVSAESAEDHFIDNIGDFNSLGSNLSLVDFTYGENPAGFALFFDKKIDYSTITSTNIIIKKEGKLVNFTLDYKYASKADIIDLSLRAVSFDDSFIILLSEPLEHNVTYSILIQKGIMDLEGNYANYKGEETFYQEVLFELIKPTFTANFDNNAKLDYRNPLQVTFSSTLKSLENVSENIYVTNLTTNEKVLISHPDISNNLIIQMNEIFYTNTSSKYRLTIKNFTSSDNIVMDEFNIDFELGVIYNEKFYKTVEVGTNIWLDRNIGATQRCNEDGLNTECFGGYFQWGRLADGHEFNNSITNKIKKTTITLEETNTEFISEWDWLEDGIDDDFSLRKAKWDSLTENSVCPTGFRVPTFDELNDNTLSDNKIKLAISGMKNYPGSFNSTHSDYVNLWSSTPLKGIIIIKSSMTFGYFTGVSSLGTPIRCIKGE